MRFLSRTNEMIRQDLDGSQVRCVNETGPNGESHDRGTDASVVQLRPYKAIVKRSRLQCVDPKKRGKT